jgi:coproporphyrinogen III oxidase-like Fe-S oxidoreductase
MARGHHKDTAGRERQYYRLIRETLASTYGMGSAWCFTRGAGAIDEYIVDEEDYVGVGSGSFSYVAGVAASTTFSIHGYQERMADGRSPIMQARQLDPAEQMRYDFLAKLFGLKMDKATIEEKYAGRFAKTLRKEIFALRVAGALRDTGTGYALGKNGMYLWVVLMREFLTAVNNLRADMRHHIRDELRQLEEEPE